MKGTWPHHFAAIPTESVPLPVLRQLNAEQRRGWLADFLGARVERDIRDPGESPRLVVTFAQ